MEFLIGIEPREYQKKIFQTCLEKNCLVVLPTGLGKTLIALMVSIQRAKDFPGKKIVFLAPTKPLVEQHLNTFKKHLPELFADLQIFTGAIKPSQRKKTWGTADIIFSTPQCVANDVKKGLYNLNEVCLLIQDEAHRCIKNYDYNYLAKKYKEQSSFPRIIGMTASPGNDILRIKEICKNLFIEEVELRTRESEDVTSYLQKLEFEKIIVDFPKEFEELKNPLTNLLGKKINELRERRILFGPATKTGLLVLQKKISGYLTSGSKNFNYLLGASTCAQAIKLQHALELLETQTLEGFNNYLKNLLEQTSKKQSKGVIKLTNSPEFKFIFSLSNELLEKKFENPKLKEIEKIVGEELKKNSMSKIIVFSHFRETAEKLKKTFNQINGINAEVFVGQANSDGKKSGSKGLNQNEQKVRIQKFSSGEINVLCATSIGEEGLDLPEVSMVIFYESVSSAIRSIQRGGRTARLKPGKIIILMVKGTRDESFFYVSKNREKKMKEAIQNIKESFSNKNKLDFQKKL